MQRFVVETPPLHRPRLERLDDHVGGPAQSRKTRAPSACFRSRVRERRLRLKHERRAASARRRASPGRLDLDDVGAVLGELEHAERARDATGSGRGCGLRRAPAPMRVTSRLLTLRVANAGAAVVTHATPRAATLYRRARASHYAPAPMATVKVNGLNIGYELVGDGPDHGS